MNRQCKIRLSKWYTPCPQKERDRISREIGFTVTRRSGAMCNFVEWGDNQTVIYKRYAGLYFIICVDKTDNELIDLEVIHRYGSFFLIFLSFSLSLTQHLSLTIALFWFAVYILDKYFGSVTELDLIYDFTRVCFFSLFSPPLFKNLSHHQQRTEQAYVVLDELLIAGEQQECSAMEVLRIVDNQDEVHKSELLDLASQLVPASHI